MDITIFKASRKKRKNRNGKRSPRYWIVSMTTMGAIIAFTFGNSHKMNIAYASDNGNGVTISKPTKNNITQIDFNIPEGSLGEVIREFEKVTGIQIKVDNKEILNIASKGVVGSFSAEQALSLILSNTGVSYVFLGARNITLSLRAESAVVDVEDTGIAPLSSPKYTEPLRDIPQTVSIISSEMIQQQGATSLRDVVANVPGITMTAGEGGVPAGDNLNVRGFSARNDIFVDGVRDLGAQSRDPFNLEQVEIIKGPNSSFSGRGSTGGTINLATKLPNLRRSIGGSFALGNNDLKRGTVDVNLPIGDTIAVRLNAMGHDADFAGREGVQNRRWGLAPTVMFGIGKATRYSFGYFYLEQDNVSDYGIPWVPANNNALASFRDRPAPVPRETFYGYIDRDREKLRSDQFTAKLEHDINDMFTIRNQFRYGYSRRDSIASPPRFANVNSTTINREMRSWWAMDDIFDNQTDLSAKFKTGNIEHSALVGTAFSYEKSHRINRSATNSPTTLLNPNPFDVYTGVITQSPLEPEVTANSAAVYFIDTIKFNKQWEFVGSLRWDRFDVRGQNVVSNAFVDIDRVDSFLSGRAALIFKPIEAGTFYASFGTSANPSLEGLLYQPADVSTDPEKSRNYELGTKWNLFDGKLLLTGAVFRVQKTDARTPSLIAGEPPTLDGDQRVDGIEIGATGNITRNWQIFAGYALLDGEIISSNTPTEVGRVIQNTPRNSFNIWTTYRWDKLFFGGGPRFVGRRFGNNTNTRLVDNYTLLDLLASYQITKNIDLRFNMNNVTNEYYIDRMGGGHIVPGGGRQFMISTGFNF